MKVAELIELLQDFEGDAEVMFSYNYGDYWRTTVAAPVKTVDDGKVVYSGYHRMDKVVEDSNEPDEDSEPNPNEQAVVLLG